VSDPYAALIAELIEVGADAVHRGLVLASAGNLSARVPSNGETYVITAARTWLDRLTPDQFSVMRLDGEVVGGNPSPSTEWRLHRRTYQIRADVNSVIHLHPQTAVVLDALGHEVRHLTLDHVAYLGCVGRVPFFPNGSDELADGAAEAARTCNAVILANHGSSTLGDTIAMAYRRALLLEEAASNTFLCLQLGDTTTRFPIDALGAAGHL
jgi:L-fuculose-phosphate aldolase